MNSIQALRDEISAEAVNHIMPFWLNLKDETFGGFYGFMDNDLNLDKEASKGGIATARLLWSFSAAYRTLKNSKYLECADHAYDFLINHIIDEEEKGLYWLVDYKGQVADSRKHIYAQSFGIYGLSEYYRVTEKQEALDKAIDLFRLIEEKGYDPDKNIYKEEFTRLWMPVGNEMLSENGIIAEATTNTHLHILEAYTNLYRVWKDDSLKKALLRMLAIFKDHIYKQDNHFMKVFYDTSYNELIDIQSYGHDIEASWLMDEALKVLELKDADYHKIVMDVVENIFISSIGDNGALITECKDGIRSDISVWWVQVEAMVGFMNAYEHTQEDRFIDVMNNIWDYIKLNIIDKRVGGEWFQDVDANGQATDKPMVEPWKTPYHNIRFCIEMIERAKSYDS